MMFQTLGMTQKFSRPRTPNDNPFIESAFSVVKGEPDFPGEFSDDFQADEYFDEYFGWYNAERKHGGIGFVTPDEKHQGMADAILRERRRRMQAAREKRLMINRKIGTKNLTIRKKRVA
jgi:putative transposase